MSMSTPQLSVGAIEGGLYIAFHGRATHRTTPTANQIVRDFLAAHPDSPGVAIDLGGCAFVDSTFAGWLVALHKRIVQSAKGEGGQVFLANCSDRCRKSLARMHLAELFEYAELQPPTTSQVNCVSGEDPTLDELQLMLDAHAELMQRDDENARVFAPMVEALQRQIAART